MARLRRISLIAALALSLFAAAYAYRNTALANHVRYDRFSPWNLFSTEAAIHYYFTDQIYRQGWQVFDHLANDKRIMYPSVSDDWQTSTIAMEFMPALMMHAGLFYTLTEAIFFSTNFYYGLKYVLLFILLILICSSIGLSYILTLIAMTSFHSYARSVVGFYVREDFAILFVLLSAIFFIQAHRRPREWLLLLTAATVIIALNSWHFSPFLYLPAAFLLLWIYLARPEYYPEKNFLTFTGILMGGCLLFPITRFNRLCFSPFILACLMFAVSWRFNRLRQFALRRRLVFLGVIFTLALVAGGFMLSEHSGHVFSTIREKIMQGGVKPADPRQISFLTRMYWDGDYVMPTAGEWYLDFRLLAVFCAAVLLASYLKDRKLSKPQPVLFWLSLITVALSLTARRNLMVSILIAAIVAGLLLREYWTQLHTYLRIALQLLAVASLALLPWGRPTVTMALRDDPHVGQLVEWLNGHKEMQPAITGHFPELPALLAFTHASIVTHSKFENRLVRDRAEDFYKAMYGPADQLPKYLADLNVNLVLASLDYFDPRRQYQGGVTTTDGTALAELARVIEGKVKNPHFEVALDMSPRSPFVLLYFYPQRNLSEK